MTDDDAEADSTQTLSPQLEKDLEVVRRIVSVTMGALLILSLQDLRTTSLLEMDLHSSNRVNR